jgi:hypothetical protein
MRQLYLVLLAMGALVFCANVLFGLYVTGLKLYSSRIVLSLISLALLSVWPLISYFAYFLAGIAQFSSSDKLLDRLAPSLVVLVYVVIGLVVFVGFKIIDSRT